MGVRFNLEHANFLGYLLSPAGTSAPRAEPLALEAFFLALSWSGKFGQSTDMSAFDGNALRTTRPAALSNDPAWLDRLRTTADGCHKLMIRRFSKARLLRSAEVAALLSPLRPFFTGYSLSALVLPGNFYHEPTAEDDAAVAFFEEAAVTSGQYGIFFMPDRADRPLTILDPFPQLTALAEIPIEPPLVAFWSPNGAACVLALDEAKNFYDDRLRPILELVPLV
jgi:hypothetical protein